MSPGADPPGWHGKLPSLGDFASRRLDPDFLQAWDGWLAAGLHALREGDAEGWLDAYLASPTWRFLLLPGALGEQAGMCSAQTWAGVLMPSVDRVGRYFPLTIAAPLASAPAGALPMRQLWDWLGRLDELAADALHDDWTIEQLERELSHLGGPVLAPPAAAAPLPAPGALVPWPLATVADAGEAIDDAALRLWCAHAEGLCCWFTRPETGASRLLVSRGLPAPAALAQLLGS